MGQKRVFDTVLEEFDKYRPRYSAELFTVLITYAGIGFGKPVLELGLEARQSSDNILR